MKFMVDECVGPRVARWLKKKGYEVFSVYDEARGASDDEILEKAYAEKWILITSDKDFGEKIYRENYPHEGVILLRLEDERPYHKIEILEKVLKDFADKLKGNFVVVTERGVRISSQGKGV
ncbi:MAG TPA: hypothetical protein ENJ40_02355 [Thermosulfurimonas dismutans]|uniref:DUF5615 domain-containing protein n=1 Tax=Thermosulfurimonas dismutans TaxID=999894 RepID=A0A7C3CWZ6_9BACT|nr:hypothetical protein [Thermosulfurimonas dismutans]